MQNATRTQLEQLKKQPAADNTPRSRRSFPKWYPKWPETELSSGRLFARIIFAVIFFILIDQALSTTFSSRFNPIFDNDYRFKTGTDITPIHLYVEHIKQAKSDAGPKKTSSNVKQIATGQASAKRAPGQRTTIAFLGSSPTYGHRIKDSSNTYPYSFEKELNIMAAKQAAQEEQASSLSKTDAKQMNNIPNHDSETLLAASPSKNALNNTAHKLRSDNKNDATNTQKAFLVALQAPKVYAETAQAPEFKVYNLASNGQLVSDQYYIAKSLINDVDTFVIQLNYHTFNKSDDKRPAIRYPDLPKRLGIDISTSEAALLGNVTSVPTVASSNSVSDKFNASLSRALASASFTFANRDFITEQLFGGPPEQLLENYFDQGRLSPGKADTSTRSGELFGESNKPFSELKPVQQMLIIKTVSGLYDFKIDTSDREVVFLRKLVDLLAGHKKKAVFFITPLNVEALDQFGIFNWDAYDSNSRTLQAIVEHKKLKFVDANAGTDILPADDFFDVSHTLDKGGTKFGKQLAGETSRYFLNGGGLK